MNEYILMHRNDQVAKVNIGESGIEIDKIIKPNLMPFGVVETEKKSLNDQLTDWNGNRCIPFGRPNYKQLAEQYNIKRASDWIAKSYMCSLTDCYWFKPKYSLRKWKDVNFRDNGFSSNLYKHLFYGKNNEPINDFNSPDITTDGAEPKMWVEQEDDFYLLKHYSESTPRTVCNEYMVSKLFAQMGIDCVNYDIIWANEKLCCISKCFIESNDEEFVAARDLMNEYGCSMKNIGQLMSEFGFEKEFNEMVIGDYLSGNSDRHSGNFGVIIDSKTQKIKRFAPLFDHGEAYIYENMDRLTYIVGETTFGKAIENVDEKYLNIVNNIDKNDVANILDSVPYIDLDTKDEIYNEFLRRIDHVHDLIIEKEIDYDREF